MIKDVIEQLRTVFNNEGVQEEVLERLKQAWVTKLKIKSQPKQALIADPHHPHAMHPQAAGMYGQLPPGYDMQYYGGGQYYTAGAYPHHYYPPAAYGYPPQYPH